MQTFSPLLAAGGWEQIIVVIVFFLISALGQLLSSKKEKQRPRPQPPKMRAGGGPQPPQPETKQDELRGEVEDFLRQMRGEKPAKKPKQRPVAVKVETVRAEPIVLAAEPSVRESVQEHVTRRLSSSQIATHASHLGEQLEQTDERMEAHLQETFQHRLGKLQHAEQLPRRDRPSAMAEEVVKMLASPQGMQQAVLAAEILRRPEL